MMVFILSVNRLWRTRINEIGIIRKDFCLYFGLSGICCRSVMIILDGRFIGLCLNKTDNE